MFSSGRLHEEILLLSHFIENFVNHMLVVLWAGQFNTGSALFWNMFYILKHTDVREKVEKEIQTVLTSLKDKTDPGTIKPKITLDDILKIEKQDLNKFVILGENIQDLMRQRGLTLIR